MEDEFLRLVRELGSRDVRCVLIGVAGANYFAPAGGAAFTTEDRDLFLPAEVDNLMRAWDACEAAGLTLWSGNEPLDTPHDRFIADAVVARRALTRATKDDLHVDLTLVMAGFDFETVWQERTRFVVDSVEIPAHVYATSSSPTRLRDARKIACSSPHTQRRCGN